MNTRLNTKMSRKQEMIEIIASVLEDCSKIQTNLSSASARYEIAESIVDKLGGMNSSIKENYHTENEVMSIHHLRSKNLVGRKTTEAFKNYIKNKGHFKK